MFKSPLFQRAVIIQIAHGKEGEADEILGPIADDLSAAMQVELKAVLGISK